jgi:transcriptional regulator with PAS, ATPase and Fis domain
MQCLLAHSWPGNVRELQNMIEKAVILTGEGRLIEPAALGLAPAENAGDGLAPKAPSPIILSDEIVPLEEIEKACILNALRVHKGNRTHAAKALGIALRTMRNRIAEFRAAGVAVPESESGEE